MDIARKAKVSLFDLSKQAKFCPEDKHLLIVCPELHRRRPTFQYVIVLIEHLRYNFAILKEFFPDR